MNSTFVTKADLAADQERHPPYGTYFTRPLIEYTRLHQTSGTTTGRPLVWLDTAESWRWVVGCWTKIYRHVGIQPGDRLFFAFSFGPFLGFWSAFEAAQQLGMMTLSGGGMSTSARLRHLLDHRATIVLCTPTYALHLAEHAAKEKSNLADSAVRTLIVAGEPGGLIPATRQRIESAFGARVFDHYGLTEIGPVAVETADAPGGLLVLDDYVAEIIEPQSSQPTLDGEIGELVLSNPGRVGASLSRYRTGDLVRGVRTPAGVRLEGGILGRADDMIHIRGNNVYPAALDGLLRQFDDLAEYQVEINESKPLTELVITVEPIATADGARLADQVGRAIHDQWLFRPRIVITAPGTLPRFEMKARRIIRKR